MAFGQHQYTRGHDTFCPDAGTGTCIRAHARAQHAHAARRYIGLGVRRTSVATVDCGW